MFEKEFSKASKQDVMKLVGAVERMDRSEATKRDYKILIVVSTDMLPKVI